MFLKQRTPLVIVLKANLRRQAGPLVALATAVAVVSYVLEGKYEGPGLQTDWAQIGSQCSEAGKGFGGAAAGLLAGWQGGAEVRNDSGWMAKTSVRGAVPYQLVGLVSGVVWPLTGYVLATVVLLVWPVVPLVWPYQTAPVGRAPLDMMIVDAAVIVAVSCIAYLLGRTVPLRVTAPIVSLAIPVFWQTPWGRALGGSTDLSFSGDPVPSNAALWAPPQPPHWLPWCWAVLFGAVAVVAVLLCARCWKPAVALALVTVALGLGVTKAGGTAVSAFNTMEIRCTGHAPTVCTSVEDEGQRQQLQRQVAQLSQRLEGVREAPTHYVWTHYVGTDYVSEELSGCGERGGRGGVRSPWAVTIRGQSPTSDIAADIVEGSSDCDSVSGTPEAYALHAWLTDASAQELTAEKRSGVNRLNALSARERAAWIGRYLAAVKRGATPPPIPDPEGR
ncbi:hypothetical protein ACFYNL_39195 [Streptomyces sp. NPDC007808]|uniref:hypothetical protein n=1 Tax=Streptomyces sp. NPDC007808 TaxID=3364779 RepID=UPI0036816DB0